MKGLKPEEGKSPKSKCKGDGQERTGKRKQKKKGQALNWVLLAWE